MGEPKTVKVCLTNQGADQETPWAHDLGPAPGGGRKVRLVNVPFLHAKPTWGDVIVVLPSDGFPTWDRGGVPWSKIATRIFEDSGRWAMIIDYRGAIFDKIAKICVGIDVVTEGAWTPDAGEPGRVYLAVPHDQTDASVMARLRAAKLDIVQIHPAPSKPKPKPKSKSKSKPAKPRPKPRAAPKKRR